MNAHSLHQFLQSELVLLDGATGTHLQAAGLPPGVSPESWVLEHQKVLSDLQDAYYQAGSRIALTFTFGGSRPKLERHFGCNPDVFAINRELAEITVAVRDRFNRAVPGSHRMVAGDIGPTGLFLYPAGDLSLDEMIDIFREQVRGILAAGVDLFIVETMMDLAETRAAVLAIQAECDLPILASLTFSENGYTLSGNSPLTCLLTLAGLGVAACGINCSFGPEKLGELIEPIRELSPIPLLLKPNAGLPQLVDGKTVFPMDPETFADIMQELAGNGVQILGGCCGTGPDHIRRLAQKLGQSDIDRIRPWSSRPIPSLICSARLTADPKNAASWPVVDYQDPDSLAEDILDIIDPGVEAVVLEFDENLMPAEWPAMLEAVVQLQAMSSIPMVFHSKNALLLESLLRNFCGRAGFSGANPASCYGGQRIYSIQRSA